MMLVEAERKEGRVFDTGNLRKEWRDACVACGSDRKIEMPGNKQDLRHNGLTLHDLRLGAARNLLLAGLPETIVIENWRLEGHKRVDR
jgi:hypothetical protein